MLQITIDESPETNSQQDYYTEQRGPILQIHGRKTDVKLGVVVYGDDDLFDDSSFVNEILEPFCATTRGKDTKHITLRNEGTTAIRYQWLRFPPNNEAEYLLSNPAGCVNSGGYLHNLTRSSVKTRQSDEKVWKQPCLQFRFREFPSVILPGQTLEFDIIFRSLRAGYFFETLYLMTHPKITDETGRRYCVRLTGICMDPDYLETDSSNSRPENVRKVFKQSILELEAKDFMDSILDHALFIEPEYPSTLPFMRVTSESIFHTHNRKLVYHYNISESALETVRRLIELLIPKDRIENNEGICTLSIESLYSLLWTRNSPRDIYWMRFKTEHAENLLKQLSKSSSILISTRKYIYPIASTRKITASYATLLTLIDEILIKMEYIEKLYKQDSGESELLNPRLPSGNEDAEEPGLEVSEENKRSDGPTANDIASTSSMELYTPFTQDQETCLEKKLHQAKLTVFEEMLAEGVERIICGVDAFNSMEDYRASDYLAKPSSAVYCCND